MFLIRLLLLMAGKDTKVCTSAMPGRAGNGLILSALLVLLTAVSTVAMATQAMDGKTLVMKRSKGNCLACHAIADGELPGNIGPPLVAMKARFPDADILRKQIWDATASNPDTRMPPFGRHGILSGDEIDLIVEYLYTL
jgi:sulfur-oxidizing protein SoxX